jgi:hypothetical protein
VGQKAKDNPSQDFSTVNGTGTVHDTQNPTSSMMMMKSQCFRWSSKSAVIDQALLIHYSAKTFKLYGMY